MEKLINNQKKIISGFFVSVITGYMLSALYRGTFENITSMEKYQSDDFVATLLSILACSAAAGIMYILNDSITRIVMFISVYIFAVLCAYNGYGIVWSTETNNVMGAACFNAVLCLIIVVAFLYVKRDIYSLVKKIKINKKATYIMIGVIGALLIAFIAGVTVLRYVTYSNSTYDFGIFAQMYESMIQRGTLETTVERSMLLSHFGVHFSPIIYITYPIYLLFPSPITVQMIQAVMIALPIIPIVLLCRKFKLSNWLTFAACALYALYPATAGGTFYDMHENCFLAFGLLMIVWAVETNRHVWLVISVIFSYAIKEDVAIYVLVLGLYWLLSRRYKIRGTILICTSVIYFIIAVGIVNSYGLGVLDMHFSNLYMNKDGNIFEIIKTILTNPAYLIGETISNYNEGGMQKIEYIIYMIVPVAGVLLTFGKKYSRYILLAPLVVLNLFTVYLYQHSVTFHYNYGIIALIMYLIIMNVSEMKYKKAKTRMTVSVLCASIMFVGVIFPKLIWYTDKLETNKATYQILDEAMEIVPEGASVCASGFLMPHLSDHLELYDQRHLTEDKYTDYLVVDEMHPSDAEKFDNILASGQYESIYKIDGIVQIYMKK